MSLLDSPAPHAPAQRRRRRSSPSPGQRLDLCDAAKPRADVLEEAWLLGQPALQEYLDFVRKMGVDGERIDPRGLCEEWRTANDYYYELEQGEAGIADTTTYRDLDPAMRPLAETVMENDAFRRTFDNLPTSFGMVELDRLIVFQQHVTQSFVERLAAQLGPRPEPAALFRFCLPIDRPNPPTEIRRIGSRRYAFLSESTDLRFHDPVLLTPAQSDGYASFGPVAGVVGLVVGFGVNVLSVLRADDRFMLQNGYHRACALRSLGITHAPCVIKTVTRRDELALVAAPRVIEAPAFYFKATRPPLLKDFFDPRICKLLPVRRMKKMIEVNFEIREFDVAEQPVDG